jgi:hypothetical protein
MKPKFYRLNEDWNADPNAPSPAVAIDGSDIVLSFLVNSFIYRDFKEGDRGRLRFRRCERYRLGPTNDEGWYLGQCRFSGLAPAWGDFYLIDGDAALLEAPEDWKLVSPSTSAGRHFLFYLRDNTFECIAEECAFEPSGDNALLRSRKLLSR